MRGHFFWLGRLLDFGGSGKFGDLTRIVIDVGVGPRDLLSGIVGLDRGA
jgi:hypothetical protein